MKVKVVWGGQFRIAGTSQEDVRDETDLLERLKEINSRHQWGAWANFVGGTIFDHTPEEQAQRIFCTGQ